MESSPNRSGRYWEKVVANARGAVPMKAGVIVVKASGRVVKTFRPVERSIAQVYEAWK